VTSAIIRITTAPVRWIIPKTGGFSSARVPRPGAPFHTPPTLGASFVRRPRDGPSVPATAETSSHSTAPESVAGGRRSMIPWRRIIMPCRPGGRSCRTDAHLCRSPCNGSLKTKGKKVRLNGLDIAM
jgi:hypothetical protein